MPKGKYKIDGHDGFTYNHIHTINPRSIQNRYFYKLRQAFKYKLSSPIAKRLAGLILIDKDLRNILDWIKQIQKLKPREKERNPETHTILDPNDQEVGNLSKALTIAICSSYAKCFNSCEGRSIKLYRKDIDHKYAGIHDEIISYRNNFAAHSGKEFIEVSSVYLIADSHKRRNEVDPIIMTELGQPYMFDEQTLDELAELIKLLHESIEAQKILIGDKLLIDSINKGKSYWLKRKNCSP